MVFLRRFSFFILAFFQFQAFAQQPRVIVVNSTSKELKRAAHRLRIPVEQLKNARGALQEATDMVSKIEPYPTDQLYSLANSWQNLNRSKAKTIVNSFIQDLRSQASQPSDLSSYQRATSTAISLMQSMTEADYEKVLEMIRNWPDPPESFGDSASNFLKSMETQARMQVLMRLANSNPEKAYELLSQSRDSGSYNYFYYGQIAQRMMGMGKKDDALKIIDETMNNFTQHANDPRALQEFESFIMMTAQVNSSRTVTAFNQWTAQLMNQPQQGDCAAKLKSGDTTLDLTCSESRILNVLRGLPSRLGTTNKAIDSVPGLKLKLDKIGGVDGLIDSGMYGSPPVQIMTYDPRSKGGLAGSSIGGYVNNMGSLLQELLGKLATNPALVKQKLRNAVRGPEDIDMLINLAMSASYQDPDLADLALEMAEPLLLQVESVQKRSSILQTMIHAYRQADGEVDIELLKSGFILADDLRQELSKMNPNMPPGILSPADQLEAFLVSESARDSYDAAISFVRSMETGPLKLASMLQIVQALSQSNF